MPIRNMTARGRGNIDWSFGTGEPSELVSVEIHFNDFTGSASTNVADVVLSRDSGSNLSGFDSRLFTVKNRGLNEDVHFRVPEAEREDKWRFCRDDLIKITMTSPDTANLEWGGFARMKVLE